MHRCKPTVFKTITLGECEDALKDLRTYNHQPATTQVAADLVCTTILCKFVY